MTAAPVTPDPNDWSGVASILGWLPNWITTLFTGGFLGIAFWSGRKVQAVEGKQNDHTEILARHAAEIENLRKAQNDANITIAKLPTRDDLRDLGQTMQAQTQAQIQAAVSQIGQMIASGYRDMHHR